MSGIPGIEKETPMNGFRKALVVGALAAGMLLNGCAQPAASARSSSSGSVALSTDDALLYAVDTDNGIVAVVDTKTETKLYQVKVGDRPARVVVGTDDTVYVTNRGSNTVSVIRKGEQKESAQIEVGTEPVGLAVSTDNKTLYVVNATAADTAEHGSLTAIDLATLQPTFEVALGAEPRGIALLGNDRAVVSLFKEGELQEVDLKTHKAISNGIGIYESANATRRDAVTSAGSFGGTFSTFKSRAVGDVVATPDGTRVFAPVVWAREDPIGRRPSAAGGYYSAGGPCNVGAVATAGLVVADQGGTNSNNNGGSLQPQVDDLTACVSSGTVNENKDYPTTALAGRPSYANGNATADAIQGPVAAAVDPTGTWLYVVNKETSNVAVIPAFRRTGDDLDFRGSGTSVRDLVNLRTAADSPTTGADGIALTRDGRKAYVYNQFDHRLDLLTQSGTDADRKIVRSRSIPITHDPDGLSAEVSAGRRMFYDAIDPRLSSPTTTVSCGTCHLEGLDDGHVWSFPDGPRQTPALAGRHLLATAPYHWSGEFSDIPAFMNHTIKERMGGTGLPTESQSLNIAKFIEAMPAPRNANLKAIRTEAQLRGAQVFQSAQCATCHSGETLTNNSIVNVGTLVMAGKNPDNGVVVTKGINVPSLLGLARTAPYLHDGSAATLEDRINNNPDDKHGATRTLTLDQKSDLIAYLKTL
jgi:YVTN family beta-propeller protein